MIRSKNSLRTYKFENILLRSKFRFRNLEDKPNRIGRRLESAWNSVIGVCGSGPLSSANLWFFRGDTH